MDEFLIITPMKNTDLYLYHCGISSCNPGHFFGPGIADHYIIHYVIDGYGTLNVNNECYSLKKGNFFLQEPNVLTHYKADYNDPWTYCWVAFNGLKAKEYIASIGVTHDNPISSYCHGDALVNCIHQMTTYEGSPKSKTIGLMGLLYTFLSLLIENSSQNSSITTEGNKQYIDSAINFIKMNYSRKVLISDLAAYVGLERSYFSTLFKLRL